MMAKQISNQIHVIETRPVSLTDVIYKNGELYHASIVDCDDLMDVVIKSTDKSLIGRGIELLTQEQGLQYLMDVGGVIEGPMSDNLKLAVEAIDQLNATELRQLTTYMLAIKSKSAKELLKKKLNPS